MVLGGEFSCFDQPELSAVHLEWWNGRKPRARSTNQLLSIYYYKRLWYSYINRPKLRREAHQRMYLVGRSWWEAFSTVNNGWSHYVGMPLRVIILRYISVAGTSVQVWYDCSSILVPETLSAAKTTSKIEPWVDNEPQHSTKSLVTATFARRYPHAE